MKNQYKFCSVADLLDIVPSDLYDWLTASVRVDIQKMKKPAGLGVFIRENLDVDGEKGINIAIVAKWRTVKGELIFQFERAHVFTGEMPDALLDDIIFIKTQTKDPIWTN